ncbi:hypothetical protein PSN45_001849 [Yamadazyma tenuis]|uniref:Uncharacterized protein n=1 Tax=Candida tenuis (strain ATCC 10573 / BCRC 21748 / CBS 615 / JCM 9827 / NBRC 10315 / NRRL Y-1498 / VKM Y-70) TaxID=590646 RepID=G3BDV4_CANTC|nr:uncharacterized protein CANTEDRAFT_116441 [Yamadazyma tenuis ATCC 10573]EGV60390.1 hypothetical protein CANTEDRAFT_116441 [Yamadazyma tenuis ATCC 10573]WEJ94365.1 hypothetical protein PSN45_001849 [Yamadazyma tenuis]
MKLEKLRELFKDVDHFDPIVNDTYQRRVEDSMDIIDRFQEQATEQIEKLQKSLVSTQPYHIEFAEYERKREVIARYRTYNKVLFFSDKSDIINESATNTILDELVTDQIRSHNALVNENKYQTEAIGQLQAQERSYRELLERIDEVISTKKTELLSLQQQSLHQESDIKDKVRLQLDAKRKECKDILTLLRTSLHRIIVKYFSFSDAVAGTEEVEWLAEFVDLLIENSTSGQYIDIRELDTVRRELVNNLVLSNIIETAAPSDSTSGDTDADLKSISTHPLVKLRDFT